MLKKEVDSSLGKMSVVVIDNVFYHDTQTDTAPIIGLKSGNGEKLDKRKKHHSL